MLSSSQTRLYRQQLARCQGCIIAQNLLILRANPTEPTAVLNPWERRDAEPRDAREDHTMKRIALLLFFFAPVAAGGAYFADPDTFSRYAAIASALLARAWEGIEAHPVPMFV